MPPSRRRPRRRSRDAERALRRGGGRGLGATVLGLLLVLIALNVWLLVDRRRRRSVERDLYARLAVLESEREIARMGRARRAATRGEGEEEAAAVQRRPPPAGDGAEPGPSPRSSEAGSRGRPRGRGAGLADRLSALRRVDRLPSAAMVAVGVVGLGIMVVHLLSGSRWCLLAATASACRFLSARLAARRRP